MTDPATAPTDTPADPAPVVQPAVNSYDEILTAITKPDGTPKYESVDIALQSIPHAQNHISQMEQENADLKAELAKRANSEDILNQIVSATKTPAVETPPVSQSMDEEAINQLVTRALTNQTVEATQQANRTKVAKAINEKFGEKSSAEYQAKLVEVGIDADTMSNLIAKSPDAALHLLDLTAKATVTSVLQGSVNTQALSEGTPSRPVAILNDHTLTHAQRIENWRAHRPS